MGRHGTAAVVAFKHRRIFAQYLWSKYRSGLGALDRRVNTQRNHASRRLWPHSTNHLQKGHCFLQIPLHHHPPTTRLEVYKPRTVKGQRGSPHTSLQNINAETPASIARSAKEPHRWQVGPRHRVHVWGLGCPRRPHEYFSYLQKRMQLQNR